MKNELTDEYWSRGEWAWVNGEWRMMTIGKSDEWRMMTIGEHWWAQQHDASLPPAQNDCWHVFNLYIGEWCILGRVAQVADVEAWALASLINEGLPSFLWACSWFALRREWSRRQLSRDEIRDIIGKHAVPVDGPDGRLPTTGASFCPNRDCLNSEFAHMAVEASIGLSLPLIQLTPLHRRSLGIYGWGHSEHGRKIALTLGDVRAALSFVQDNRALHRRAMRSTRRLMARLKGVVDTSKYVYRSGPPEYWPPSLRPFLLSAGLTDSEVDQDEEDWSTTLERA